MLSFENKKELRFVITLGTGKFDAAGNDQIILQGYRASAHIDKAGGMMMGTLRAKIYGVSQADMNSATTLQWKPGTFIPNTVEVYAIDGPSETLVFGGNIVNAWGDYQSMPDVYLHIQAQSAFYNQIKAVPPISFKGRTAAALVLEQIAKGMGYSFENNGVTAQLSDVYLCNTAMEQAKDLVKSAGCDLYLDDKIFAISPPNVPRQTGVKIAAVDNTEEINKLMAEWKSKSAQVTELINLGRAERAKGNEAAAQAHFEKAKVTNAEAEVLLKKAQALQAAERPASSSTTPIISKDTGLVGYPTFDGVGVNFQTLFNPAVMFGGAVNLETDNQRAAGEWLVTSVAHQLECEKPGGAWFSNVRGNSIGLAISK